MFHWKRLAAGLICLLLLLTVLPAQVFAAESIPDAVPVEFSQEVVDAAPAESAPEDSPYDPTLPIYHAYSVNPIFGDVSIAHASETASESEIRAALADATVYDNISQAAAYVRRQMVARNESFSVGFKTSDPYKSQLYNELLDLAMNHTGNPKEGDYLLFHYAGCSCYRSVGADYIVIYYDTLDYYTTAAQEAQMNTAVSNLLSSLNLAGKDDYQKIRAIYNWMCTNISYDHEHLQYDPSYKLMYSAYGGLIDRTCVCQGYANLFYRLALECGIDARVISGYGGGPHAWNIVKMGTYYYNLDSTWDAGRSYYSYFLNSMDNFTDHVRQQQYSTGSNGRYDFEDYTSAAFDRKYPMGPTNYTYDPDDFAKIRITGHPLSKTVTENTNAKFGVIAEGTRLTYQWQYRFGTSAWTNTTLSGAKTSLLTVPATMARNGCQYRCVVKDSAGNVTYSNPATLTVKGPVRITGHPLTKSVAVNTNAKFGVVADGAGLTYQWQYRFGNSAWTNTTLSGNKTSLLTVPATAERNGCQYRCIVKDSGGHTAYSNPATLTVKVPAKITGHPLSKTVTANTNAKFGVIASGTGLTYQWQYRAGSGAWTNTTLSGNKTSLLTVSATMARNGWQYRCVVKDSLGHTVYSNPATLTVKGPVKITGHPLSKTVTVNTNAKFGVIADGAGLTYQWQYRSGNGAWTNTTLNGAKTSLLTVPATTARNGCQYRCIVKDMAGNVAYSKAATLTVKAPVKITGHPLSKSAAVNTNAKFGVIADGAGLTYQWQYRFGNGAWTNTTLNGAKTSLLTVPATTARNGCQYRCIVKDMAGNVVYSNPATLTVK